MEHYPKEKTKTETQYEEYTHVVGWISKLKALLPPCIWLWDFGSGFALPPMRNSKLGGDR